MNSKEKLAGLTFANMVLETTRMRAEAYAEMEAKREYWKAENERQAKEYRQSMEYKQKRAKKKANRKLRKKSQGR